MARTPPHPNQYRTMDELVKQQMLATAAQKVVTKFLEQKNHKHEVYVEGLILNENRSPAHVTIWKLKKEYYTILTVKDRLITITGCPGLHTVEEFGSINSLEFYLGDEGPTSKWDLRNPSVV